ncbi:MAG: 50S ribosomal protein L6, partial [Clostridiales bacterium GWE2_32_10]
LTRTLLFNMVEGVTNGYTKELEINGVGYRAAKQGNKLVLSLGYSHPIELEDPEGIVTEVPEQTKIIVKGIDKQQ